MPWTFHRSANAVARLAILGGVAVVCGASLVAGAIWRSPYVTEEGVVREQPVPFSHEHHVSGLGIDCRYCHATVERAAFAGMPATETCMKCHSVMWTDSPMLEPVRESYRTGERLVWTRVNNLPQFVYFDHSVHVTRGVGCSSCHGRVDRMPLTYQAAPLTMEWCLSCHTNPAANLRPRDQVFRMDWTPPADQEARGAALAAEYRTPSVRELTSCSTCHR